MDCSPGAPRLEGLPSKNIFFIETYVMKGPQILLALGRPKSAHGTMGRQIDPAWGGPIELFHVPASNPRLV